MNGNSKFFRSGCSCSGTVGVCAGHEGLFASTGTFGPFPLNPLPTQTYPIPPITYPLTVGPWTANKNVACTPFKARAPQKVMRGGMALLDKKIELEELRVIFATEDGKLQPSMRIWIRASDVVHTWAKEVFTLDGKEFILVPESAIQMVNWATFGPTVVSVTPDGTK